MTAREDLHRLVDTLPDEQVDHARKLLEDLSNPDDDWPLTPEAEESVNRGLEDIRAGRVTPWEDIKKDLGL